MNQLLLIVLILLALGAGWFVIRMLLHSRADLSPEEAHAAVDAGTAVLVDVREGPEWRGGVAQPAVLLPMTDLFGARKKWRPFLENHRGKRILLYCQSGGRSGMAASKLRAEGFDAANIGGFSGWARRGLPVRRP